MPCGGTHVKSTAEVGDINLKRVNIGGGKERIEIKTCDVIHDLLLMFCSYVFLTISNNSGLPKSLVFFLTLNASKDML